MSSDDHRSVPRRGPVPHERVVDHIPPGADVILPMANGEPVGLMDVLEEHHERLTGVRVHQMHCLHERPYVHGEAGDHLRHVSYFLSPATRQAFWDGDVDLVPNNFSEMPRLLREATACTIVLAAASPPDAHGYFSLGTNAEYVAPLIGHAPFFLEVNPAMPRTFGLNQIHVSQVVGWSEGDWPLVEVPPVEPDERDRAIAQTVAELIPDRATIQVGIGGIPNALLGRLRDHRDLGIHTELISDGIMALVDCGVVTGTHKHLRPNKVVATFAMGTEGLYRWMDDNRALEMLPVDEVNDPRVIAQEPTFISINATTEVDLIGQCASETMAGRYWSSSGGQADFARGAMYSEGGKAFIVLHATTGSGRSRIRVRLTEGSVVTTLKNTVDHVVTEHGIARLRGRSLAERARALIAIAAPEHREDLEREARETGVLASPHVAPGAGGPKTARTTHRAAPTG
ncbi:MAG TPA: acetyl-CoA hydrolase/transferase C-terminal domain-containing protein [Solirubrobacteraceae bacterium]|nr:acetyl-CoA hydrolase/transferase C-terminal domain-containing protein [Solirubrobacteraceae bacterium]